jgi:CBS domain-containing protein
MPAVPTDEGAPSTHAQTGTGLAPFPVDKHQARRVAMSLERFCRKPIVTALPTQTVRDVALKMRDHHVGAVVVVEEDRPVGVVTDRDIALRVILEGRDAETTPVRDVMSRDLALVRDDDKIDDAVRAIREAGVRRVPIVDSNGKVVGMVALDDLVVLFASELGATVSAVRANRGP